MRARLFLAVVVAIGFIGASSDAQNVTSTVAFTSTRENPDAIPPIVGGEIYLMDRRPDGSFSAPHQVTENCAAGIAPALSTENCYADTRISDQEVVSNADCGMRNYGARQRQEAHLVKNDAVPSGTAINVHLHVRQ